MIAHKHSDPLLGDFEEVTDKKYICRTGNMSYLVTVQ